MSEQSHVQTALDTWATVPELAQMVGRTPDVVRNHLRQGRIEAERHGREWVFNPAQWHAAVGFYWALAEEKAAKLAARQEEDECE